MAMPHLKRRNGRWYVWKDRASAAQDSRPLGLSGRRTPTEALKAFYSFMGAK